MNGRKRKIQIKFYVTEAVSYTHLDVYKRQALNYLQLLHGKFQELKATQKSNPYV